MTPNSPPTRRDFIKTTALLAGTAITLPFFPSSAAAQDPSAVPPAGPSPANPDVGGVFVKGPDGKRRQIILGPDDKPAFPVPPKGFDVKRDGIPHGRMELITYDSKTVGVPRKMTIYTPPGYSASQKYPVVYLLHGIGGDETEWARVGLPDIILDNLLAEGKVTPMIAVMPNGRARPDDRPPRNLFTPEHSLAFANFENDLLTDVIPAIETRYSVQADREHRSLAGLSMGAGQALNFGLAHLDTFAWVGAFSPAPDTKQPAKLIADPATAREQLKLLWLSCGNQDGLIGIAQGVHAWLKANNIPHIWHVDGNAHDTPEWRSSLYHYSQLLFR